MVNRSTPERNTTPGPTGRKAIEGYDTIPLVRDDSSDSGSDLAGDSTDSGASIGGLELDDLTTGDETDVRLGEDTGLDRVVGAEEAGLGGGLDQAEEAQLGITDEEIAELANSIRSTKP